MGLKDALLKAYAEKGATPPIVNDTQPKRVVLALGSKGQKQLVVVKYGKSAGRRATKLKTPDVSATSLNVDQPLASTRVRQDPKVLSPEQSAKPVAALNPPAMTKPVQSMALQPVIPEPEVRLDANAKCLVSISENIVSELLDVDVELGLKESIHQRSGAEVHEMAFGLDFGTSSVKVVIGDLASDKAYAVPFIDAVGIDAYLLPSRIFESVPETTSNETGVFSLTEAEHAFRDLKLSLLGNPESVDRQIEVIAFLALVIQRARAWLFTHHKAVYKPVECLWQLSIGLPAASALNNAYVPLFEKMLRSAWHLAGLDEMPDRALAQSVRDCVFNSQESDDGLEVQVIPEIAAQIFGFVASNSFDRNAANRYLMVDVGAGTVDSSLFKVIPGRGGRWNFEFYTAVVQPYGVSNLHAYRVDWWHSKLTDVDGADGLFKLLQSTKFATDLGAFVPAHNQDYFEGVHLTKDHPDQPDSVFFDKFWDQVRGATLYRAWKDGFLAQHQLTNTPMFLCGGGARSDFYLKLETKLIGFSGCTWLSAEPWQLGFPGDLDAEGTDEKDFDRLSVAYGLSKLNVGQITQATPLPKVAVDPPQPFTDRYIDKDQT
jgi:hypothetical protein